MATRIKGYKLKAGKLVLDPKAARDASARARAAGKPPMKPRKWRVRAARQR
jgi:hypothetical protein